jgi:flavodoxin
VAISIVCYSNTGNNQILADHLAERLQCGIARITESRHLTWLNTLLEVTLGLSPRIEPLHTPLETYQHVILIGPVWAARLASPLRTLLTEHRQELGEYSFITLCG